MTARLLVFVVVVSPCFSEFQVLHTQRVTQWITHYSMDLADCSDSFKNLHFPDLYRVQNWFRVPIGIPRNISVIPVDREAQELGGLRNYYYPGVIVSFYPPVAVESSSRVQGYELTLNSYQGHVCLIMDFSDLHWSEEDKIDLELFPLFGLTHYQLTVKGLPEMSESRRSDIIHFTTGPFNKFRSPNRTLPPSANWYADMAYHVITTYDESNNSTRRSIEIVFSRPPPQYSFELFEITLVPRADSSGIRRAKTTRLYHVFDSVRSGSYKVRIKPVDEFFSHSGRCLCRLSDSACSNCISAEMEAIVT